MIDSYFNQNIHRRHSSKVSKVDKHGSNCDNLFEVIYKYEHGFPDDTPIIDYIIFVSLCIMILTSLC